MAQPATRPASRRDKGCGNAHKRRAAIHGAMPRSALLAVIWRGAGRGAEPVMGEFPRVPGVLWTARKLSGRRGTSNPVAVDEFSAATGRPIARTAGPPFWSDNPGGAIAAEGAHIWATDTNFYSYRGWVAELSARTGGLVRVIGARSGHPERS
jgi:hypothetical protein